ncbi:ABC transporter permease subunit [Streptomyces sp. SID5914]|nr:sugar ABC transporter permease [Streptomyces sp. SID5914]MZG12711.1 ABC transporter permease subunit [Streptomyces sp. SID5914]
MSSQSVARRPRVTWRTIQKWKGASFTFPFIVGFALFTLVPVFLGLSETFYTTKSAGGLGLGGGEVVSFTGLDQIFKAAKDPTFWSGMGRVFGFGLVIVPLVQGVALIMALLLDAVRRKVVGRFRLALLLPYMVPGMIATMIWLYMYSPAVGPLTAALDAVGLHIDFFSGGMVWASMGNLILWNTVGFNMLILYGSLQSVPGEIFDAARVDGAGELRIAWSIKVPFVRASLVLTMLLSIIGTVQLFAEPMLFRTVAPETITRDFTPAMYIYDQAFLVGNINYATALSIVLALVVGVISAVVYRTTNTAEDA